MTYNSPELGQRLMNRRVEAGFSQRYKLARELEPKFGLQESSISAIIREFEEGNPYGLASSVGIQRTGMLLLQRFSAYLEAIQYNPSDPELQRLREEDPRFVYSPARKRSGLLGLLRRD